MVTLTRQGWYSMSGVSNWIKKWNKSYNRLVGEEDNNGLGQQAIIDDFKKPEWFKNDLEKYLEKVENKIKDLDNSKR